MFCFLFCFLTTLWQKVVSTQVKLRVMFVLFSGKPARTYEVPRKVLCMKCHWEGVWQWAGVGKLDIAALFFVVSKHT